MSKNIQERREADGDAWHGLCDTEAGPHMGSVQSSCKKFQIPSDLVVRYQAIDIVGVIFSFIW
jgi:hypothetical protein